MLIDELAQTLAEYEAEQEKRVFAELDRETKIAKIGFTRPADPPPRMAGAVIGEVIYNLRAALDYMVFVLAAIDSGQIQDHTQFPIVTDQKNFSSEANKRLKGMSPDHILEIERLQPFYGCTWTAELRDLSNPDKHRCLIALAGSGEHVFRIKRMETDFKTEFNPRMITTFEDERPVIATLRLLWGEVKSVLDRFSKS